LVTVTAANGHLGRLTIAGLLERGVPAADITAAVRTPEKVDDLRDRGVKVVRGDYSDPESLNTAFAGTETLLLISGNEVGQRTTQHRNAVQAAVAAGVRRIVYTSVLNADDTQLGLAAEHKVTEQAIRESGLAYTFLRNGWYLENYTDNLAQTLETGVILGSTGNGRVAAASRPDFAEAAVAVLLGEGHENKAYELGGDEPFTLTELAEEISRQSGKTITYRDLPVEEYTKVLVGAGLPEAFAGIVADSSAGIGKGYLTTDRHDLRDLIGHPTTSLADAVAAALKS
jgi:NAD(P)H dehydrogenase (quinone)